MSKRIKLDCVKHIASMQLANNLAEKNVLETHPLCFIKLARSEASQTKCRLELSASTTQTNNKMNLAFKRAAGI